MRNCIFLQVYVTKFNIELTIVSFSLALWSNIHSDIFCKIVASHFKLNSSIIQTISRWVCICFAGFIWMEGVYGNLYHASDSSCACCCWCQFRTDLSDSNSRQSSMDLRMILEHTSSSIWSKICLHQHNSSLGWVKANKLKINKVVLQNDRVRLALSKLFQVFLRIQAT